MRKVISALLCFVIIVSACPTITYANNSEPVIEQYNELVREFDNDKSFVESIIIEKDGIVQLDGTETSIDSNLAKVNKTAMVSLNSLCKFIDAEYSDDTQVETGYSTITYDDRKVWYDENTGLIDIQTPEEDNIIILDEAPYQDNNETMVPLNQFADALGYDTYEEDGNYLLTRPYQTCRLLVSTKKRNIDTQNAIASIRDEKNDITILQFDNETDAINANDYYSNLNCIVESDAILSTNNTDENKESEFWLKTKGPHRSPNDSEYIYIDDMNDYLAKQKLEDVIIAVVDTGVCSYHPDLKDRVICADVNFSDSEQENSEDDQGHGTHVSGIIEDNTLDNVKVLAVKALNGEGEGTTYQIIQAMEYAVEQGAKVINLSLGMYGKSELMTNTVKSLWDKNITVVCAAGNNGWFAAVFTPAGISECITVMAVDSLTGKYPIFNNHDKPVDTIAPGVNVYSTYIFNEEYKGYRYASGTSMASPFVAAAAIMMYSYNISYTTEYIHEKVRDSYCGEKLYSGYRIDENGNMIYNTWSVAKLDCSKLIDIERAPSPTSNANFVDDYNRPLGNANEVSFYNDYVDVELFCEEKDAKIYYTTDGTRASKENGILYTGPFKLTQSTRVHAVAYLDGKEKSRQAYFDYYVVTTQDESAFQIDSNGFIFSYNEDILTSLAIIIPDTIRGIKVRGIDEFAFYRSNLFAVLLPDTCETIGRSAFEWCEQLQCIKGLGVKGVHQRGFFNSPRCFAFDFPNLEYLEEYSFALCGHMQDFNYPKLTTIPEYAFYGGGFTSVDFSNIKEIGKYAFYNCPKLISVKSNNPIFIDDYAFKDCFSLENVTLENIEYIGNNVFEFCNALESVSFPNFDGCIPNQCFKGCSKLYDINIPNAVEIGEGAFIDCRGLKKAAFNNVIKVNNGAFAFCTSLTKLQLDSAETISGLSSTNLKVISYPNCKTFGGAASENVEYIYLPNCTYISGGFITPNLKSVYLPKLESFGNSEKCILFEDCYSLEEFDLPNLVKIKGMIFATNKSNVQNNRKFTCKKMFYYKLCEEDAYAGKTLVNCANNMDIYKNLPAQSSEESLSIDYCCINPTFEWFYSPTGETDSFELIENSNSNSYTPVKDGYYFVRMHTLDHKKSQEELDDEEYWGVIDYIDSKVCHYTKSEKKITNYNLAISSANQFTVSIDGENSSVTRKTSGYTFSQNVPDGANVVVNYTNDDFESWVNSNNRVVSKNKSFSFIMTSNVTLTANIKKSSVISSTVSFYNANGDFISSDKFSRYIKFKADKYPSNPTLYAHTFIGWDKSVDEINNELAAGHNVTVYAQYKLNIDYKSLDVVDGEIIDSEFENEDNYYKQFSYVTVKAKDIQGLKFWYWLDSKTGIASYNPIYTFYLTDNTHLTAIYSPNDITPTAISRITGQYVKENKITFIAEHYTPNDCEVLEHGIILTKDNTLDNESFIIGANNVLKGTSTQNTNCGTYTLTKKDVTKGNNWRARSYTIYKNTNGIIHTIYSSIYG